MEYYKRYGDRKVLIKNTVDELIGEFHSYLSDDSKQYKTSATAQITYIINIFVTKNIITQYVSTIWKETDVCTNKYINATSF